MTNTSNDFFVADRQSIVGTMFAEGPEGMVKLMDKVLEQLPEDKQDGMLLKGGQDQLQKYVAAVLTTIIFFTIVYQIAHRILVFVDDKKYTGVNAAEQDRYLNIWTSQTCMFIICTMSILVHVLQTTPEGDLFGWWISNQTVHHVSDWQGFFCMFMIGYFLFDELVMHFVWADLYYKGDKVSVQMGAHHALGIVYMLTGLVVGYSLPIGMCIAFITETSTIFLNLRMLHERRDTKYYAIVSTMFFILFTATRIILMPYGLALTACSAVGVWHRLSTVRRICATINITMGFGLAIMQFFWYQFIVKAMLRLMGVIPESKSTVIKKDVKVTHAD